MKRNARLVLSFFLAAAFLVLSYRITNLRYPISGEKALLTKLERVRDYFRPEENRVIDSVLFINVAYDKELQPVCDRFGFPAGTLPVTSRTKLLRLLQYLREQDQYRYILLDVFFGESIRTGQDEELFSLIASMPRIVIPCHSDEPLADPRLAAKAGLAEYTVTYSESDFVKYPYLTDSQPSLPVKMYEEVSGRRIEKHGIFYTDRQLVRSSIVLTFGLTAAQAYADNGQKIWYNLGADLLDDPLPGPDGSANGSADGDTDGLLFRQPELTRNKYIVIGAFQGDDTHTTFRGDVAGAVINFNAFISLLNGHHLVSLTLAALLFAVFFLLSYLTLSRQRLQDLTGRLAASARNRLLRRALGALSLLCTWVGYSLFLSLLCIATYLTLGEVYDIFITSTLFYGLHLAVALSDNIRKRLSLWHTKA